MITTILQGGLGNQMFQFAMGYAQSVRFGCPLVLNRYGFQSDRMREYSLDFFPRIALRKPAIFVSDYEQNPTVHENGMPYNQSLVESIEPGDVLKGYWQTEDYFANTMIDMRWFFEPRPLPPAHHKMCQQIENADNSTFIVIRRTDYVGNAFHGELPIEYYRSALALIKNPTVFVFSDDPMWCVNNLDLGMPFTIAGTFDRTVKGHLGREDADLHMMSKCKNAIIANSSFAWWGAYLGDENRRGRVIAPKKWFGPASNEDPRDIVPARWIKI
jgi:hypothetical protein